jgi:hypothetical protein
MNWTRCSAADTVIAPTGVAQGEKSGLLAESEMQII